MALNPFFLQGSQSEQYLIQDLINEQLRMYGIEVYYLPRKIFTTDNIIREIQSSKFDDTFLIEAYLNNYEGYAPGSDIMTKFGLSLKNEISITISRERYEEFIAPFLEGISSGVREGRITGFDFADLITRPKEGDLIYFPLGERLFEIKRVESEKPFYQLGKNYVYELNCELYEYENELIDTAIDEIDNTVEDEGYITTLVLVNGGTNATATAGIGSGYIREIFLNNDGYGYTSAPTVTLSPPPSGTRATAVATVTSVAGLKSIDRILLTHAGSGYVEPPTITITGGGGTGAAATCSVEPIRKGVVSFNITNAGDGYYTKPNIIISEPTGSGITATATAESIISSGSISQIVITNPGIGYTENPTVTVAGLSTTGIGTFIYNEVVTGETSGTTARVRDYRTTVPVLPGEVAITNLRVAINSGKFSAGEVVAGSISSARYIVESYSTDSYDDPYDANKEIEDEADSILDFTESNPFGDY
jgi:hypothetical protein